MGEKRGAHFGGDSARIFRVHEIPADVSLPVVPNGGNVLPLPGTPDRPANARLAVGSCPFQILMILFVASKPKVIGVDA